jgi:hypothetical protein
MVICNVFDSLSSFCLSQARNLYEQVTVDLDSKPRMSHYKFNRVLLARKKALRDP